MQIRMIIFKLFQLNELGNSTTLMLQSNENHNQLQLSSSTISNGNGDKDKDTINTNDFDDMIKKRQIKKSKLLQKLSKSKMFHIQPIAGECTYFEIEFKNPFPEMKQFCIKINNLYIKETVFFFLHFFFSKCV